MGSFRSPFKHRAFAYRSSFRDWRRSFRGSSTRRNFVTTLYLTASALRRRGECGAAAVEFALVLAPMLVIVFGVLQFGWYFNAAQSGTSAAADAARRLSVGDCQDSVQLQNMVTSRLGAAAGDDEIHVTVIYTGIDASATHIPAPGAVGGDVTVVLEFRSADFRLPFIPLPNDGKVTRTAVARVEDTSASVAGCR